MHSASEYNLDELNAALKRTIFSSKLHYFPEIASTNTVAMQAAGTGTEEGTVFLTDQQTSGRGRNGHSWHSQPRTSILVSIVLRPRITAAQSLWLSLMAGVATQKAIHETCDVKCDLRWPNDLLAGKRKVCGILTEISADVERLRFAVIGIGINVNQTAFPDPIAALATSLRIESGKNWHRPALLCALLESLEAAYFQALAKDGLEKLLRESEAISTYIRGKRVHVDEAGGYEGTTQGLDEQGFLQVRTAEGLRRVLSGGVRELP
ncbi:MAG: biotin--[acetyl-CoA-carboxylase] ligase [Acidobacteria bacterium]|nr:biotin--[acetyl-CoA-carboxylase] ligase [Acidobacteriota bacterium]